MYVTNKNGKTLLDKAVDEEAPTTSDAYLFTIKLKAGYELTFTHSEWKAILAAPHVREEE